MYLNRANTCGPTRFSKLSQHTWETVLRLVVPAPATSVLLRFHWSITLASRSKRNHGGLFARPHLGCLAAYNATTSAFIDLWGLFPYLLDVRDPTYRNKILRYAALQKISDTFGQGWTTCKCVVPGFFLHERLRTATSVAQHKSFKPCLKTPG